MGRKKSNMIEQGEKVNTNGSQELVNAKKIAWSKDFIYTLYDLCIKHTVWNKGKNGAITSHKILWPKLVEEWKKVTYLSWDKSRLKNKLDGMRPIWKLWKNFKSEETGLGWDHEKGTVNASEEWWSLKIKENPKFKLFKDEGIEPKLEIKMDQVFGGCAQGAEKFTLGGDPLASFDFQAKDEVSAASPPLDNTRFGPPPGYEVGSNMGNDERDTVWRESNPTSPYVQDTLDIVLKGKGKRVRESDTSESNKSARTDGTKSKGGSATLLEKMDTMVQIIRERNRSTKEYQAAIVNTMSSMTMEKPKYSVTDAIRKLSSMSDFDASSQEFYYACTLIEDPQKRTILLELPDDKRRIGYIRYMYAQRKGCNL